LQRVTASLATHERISQAPKLLVNQRKKLIERLAVAVACFTQELGDF